MNQHFRRHTLKKRLGTTVALSLATLGLFLGGCDKNIVTPDSPPLVPATQDATGGNWKPVLLPQDSIPVLGAPAESGSAAYAAELQEVQNLRNGLSADQQAEVKYWSAGAVLRWNEIARQLVIKYNVAPPVGAAPDPRRPFTNPPIASRAYALLSVAQYDALVAAWNNRYRYNRQSPAKAISGFQTIVPITDAPSYPSEHAVVAAASEEILRFIFPADSAFLVDKALKHKESRIWAGANVRSDILAADSLGRIIARRVINRARTDGTRDARGADTLWKDPSNWVSLEVPARPPMLPLWGKVKLWIVPNAEMLRPVPPPALGSAEFKAALQEVRDYSDNRTREQWRIADFWADGAGTTTPPGHWNEIAADFIKKYSMNELRTARTFSLLNMAMMDGGVCCWDAKYLHVLPRPSQMDPEIKTSTGIPNFPSYTSGHSTFSAAAAEVLSYIFPTESTKIWTWADEAAISRLYGGIHYRFDCDAGFVCGKRIGQMAVAYGQQDGSN